MNSVTLMQGCHGMNFLKEAHQRAYKVIFGLGCEWHVSVHRNVFEVAANLHAVNYGCRSMHRSQSNKSLT